ncbi:ubiquitin carboxyl-terminal hydrolase family protein, putative [Ichthyophthirius multifiliis]|uniref:ubiquitinyl hydrolase 1 n=1 Tax=Ichthyophthirius multifiliis TaxID=5932 RepID=G0R552_ICHMU|nr:ubiquitin carboxyl-terminal hydrolase family protein, putative [Ichthyophthirius multifiliis]EGR27454.1 ubiquitin carboxyl-terminal hydrolase family protein, putative [Ichthyophthirius multifiliis]|eukprot:XP_004024364.1 ubiquitin carboxyl-terminal hydrolase family protein, putative [Ichthyophthirius multifiliis]
MYQGIYINYVKCENCQNQNERQEYFLDIQMTIKNIFEGTQNFNLENAFLNFLKPEQLSGQNQYFCEICQGKQNAIRGTFIQKLPSILTIQLNRFGFDYQTMKRVKINDLFEFPFILNMNTFIKYFYSFLNKQKKQKIEDMIIFLYKKSRKLQTKTNKQKKQTKNNKKYLKTQKKRNKKQKQSLKKKKYLLKNLQKMPVQNPKKKNRKKKCNSNYLLQKINKVKNTIQKQLNKSLNLLHYYKILEFKQNKILHNKSQIHPH